MTNKEITAKLQQIDNISDFCDKLIALKSFEVEYKKTPFYKDTKIELSKLYTMFCTDNITHLNDIFRLIQNKLNELDLTKFNTSLQDFIQAQELDVNNLRDSISSLVGSMEEWGIK